MATSISAWAARVHPGSPSPCSPRPSHHRRRSSSIGQRPAFSHRRPSISQLIIHPLPPQPGVFIRTSSAADEDADPLSPTSPCPYIVPSPVADVPPPTTVTSPTAARLSTLVPDLPALGYSNLFVHLPRAMPWAAMSTAPQNHPETTTARTKTIKTTTNTTTNVIVNSTDTTTATTTTTNVPTKTGTVKRLRSLAMLKRLHRKSASLPSSPISPIMPTAPLPIATYKNKALPPTPSKKSRKYDDRERERERTKRAQRLPAPLATEIALAQFTGGGSTESHVRAAMRAQAKAHVRAAAASGANAAVGGTVAIGDVYRDAAGGIWLDREEAQEYVHLLGGRSQRRARRSASGTDDEDEGWWEVIGDGDDDGDEEGRKMSLSTEGEGDVCALKVVRPADEEERGAFLPRIVVPMTMEGAGVSRGVSVLAVPVRVKRRHLRRPSAFLVDGALPAGDAGAGVAAGKGKKGRRPAPLDLGATKTRKATKSVVEVEVGFEESFVPSVPVPADGATTKMTARTSDVGVGLYRPVPVAAAPPRRV